MARNTNLLYFLVYYIQNSFHCHVCSLIPPNSYCIKQIACLDVWLKVKLKKNTDRIYYTYKTKIVLHTTTEKHDMHEKYIIFNFLVQNTNVIRSRINFKIYFTKKKLIPRTASIHLFREKEKN